MNKLLPRAVKIGSDYFPIDTEAEVPYRRINDSVMAPRADISGVPGAVNLQRDVWLWSTSDFVGGEGRIVFDSADPLGPPTFYKTDGGVDVRIRGEFSLHPDEKLYANATGGGSAPTVTTWTNTDFATTAGSPTYSSGAASSRVTLSVGDGIQSPARTPGVGPVIKVTFRIAETRTTRSNRQVSIRCRVRNITDGSDADTATVTLKDQEKATVTLDYTPAAAKTYRYQIDNTDAGTGVTARVVYVTEYSFATGPASPQDLRELRLGIGDNIWGLAYDGANTDVLKWNFTNDEWDQAAGNVVAAIPRAMTGSDQYMYWLDANGDVWQTASDGTTTQYANDPAAAGFTGSHGTALSVAVANNRLYVLFSQGLFELTLDKTSGLPLSSGSDYSRVMDPGEYPKEASPDTNMRRHMSAISNGVRWFVNVRGEQTAIYEFSNGAGFPAHQLPLGYIATAIKHYANITFIAASFTNEASSPAESRTGIFFISADNLLRFLGYLRFHDTNSEPVSDIVSYGHDVYFLQGKRIWRYSTGTGGITLENEIGIEDQTKVRAMARMDKKFWVAVEGEGSFVADDAYPVTTMWLTSPLWDYDVPDLDKILLSFGLEMAPLPANTVVYVEYALDEGAWTSAGSVTLDDTTEVDIPVSTGVSTVKFRTLQWRVGLASTDGVDTPRIRSVTARAYVLNYEKQFDMTILCEDDTASSRLISQHKSGRAKAKALQATIDAGNLTTFQTWWEGQPGLPMTSDTYSTVAIEDPFYEVTEKGQGSYRLKIKVLA